MMFTNRQLIGVGLVGAAAVFWLSRKAGAIGGALNPANPDNAIASGLDSYIDELDGTQHMPTADGSIVERNFELGDWLWRITHPEWDDPNAGIYTTPPIREH